MYLRCVKGLKWIPNALTMGNLLGGVVVCWSIVRGPDWGFGGLRAWELTEGGWAEEAKHWDLVELQGEGMIWIAGVWLLAVLFAKVCLGSEIMTHEINNRDRFWDRFQSEGQH